MHSDSCNALDEFVSRIQHHTSNAFFTSGTNKYRLFVTHAHAHTHSTHFARQKPIRRNSIQDNPENAIKDVLSRAHNQTHTTLHRHTHTHTGDILLGIRINRIVFTFDCWLLPARHIISFLSFRSIEAPLTYAFLHLFIRLCLFLNTGIDRSEHVPHDQTHNV